MRSNNEQHNRDLGDRLYSFALEIVLLVRALPKEVAAYEIGRQLLRSGTSISANYEEAKGGFSKDDFTYKISVSFKEAKETKIWLKLLKDAEILPEDCFKSILQESEEICNILAKCVKTAKGLK